MCSVVETVEQIALSGVSYFKFWAIGAVESKYCSRKFPLDTGRGNVPRYLARLTNTCHSNSNYSKTSLIAYRRETDFVCNK